MFALLALAIMLTGCGGSEAKLEAHIAVLRRSIEEGAAKEKDGWLVGGIRYDIRRTDSLVSPFEGTIEYTQTYSVGGSWERRLTAEYQRGRWVLVRFQYRPLGSEAWRERGPMEPVELGQFRH